MPFRELSSRGGFDRLPAELVYALLCYVPSPAALFCLLQASRCCNDVFRSSERGRSEILQHVLHNDLESALHSQVLAVGESTQLASWDDRESAIDRTTRDAIQVISRLTESRGNCENLLFQQPLLISHCQLHCAIELFIRDYALHALPLLDATQCKDRRSHGEPKQDLTGWKLSAHLSKLETSRLQRAFMNFELMCNIIRSIGPAPIPATEWAYNQTFHQFISAFPAPEWEEMLCVIEYLQARVEEVLDELEQDYIQAITDHYVGASQTTEPWITADDKETQAMTETAASYLRGETCLYYGLRKAKHGLVRTYHSRHMHPKEPCKPSPDAFYTRRIKRSFHRNLANVLIGKGLTYLKHLLHDGAKGQREAVASILENGSNKLPDPHIFSKFMNREHDHAFLNRMPFHFQRRNPVNPVTPGILPPPGQATHPVQHLIQVALNPPPPRVLQRPPHVPAGKIFPDDDHDHLSRPNLGWHWSRNYLHSDITGRASDYPLRRWGYVFWDADRLRKMGVTEYVHNGSSSTGEDKKRRRDEEPSAEQVLMNMGLLAESPINFSLTTETMPPEVERRVRARWDD